MHEKKAASIKQKGTAAEKASPKGNTKLAGLFASAPKKPLPQKIVPSPLPEPEIIEVKAPIIQPPIIPIVSLVQEQPPIIQEVAIEMPPTPLEAEVSPLKEIVPEENPPEVASPPPEVKASPSRASILQGLMAKTFSGSNDLRIVKSADPAPQKAPATRSSFGVFTKTYSRATSPVSTSRTPSSTQATAKPAAAAKGPAKPKAGTGKPSYQYGKKDPSDTTSTNEETFFLKNKYNKQKAEELDVVRPTTLKIILPMTIRDFAEAMKLKAATVIGYLFQEFGKTVGLNELVDDITLFQLVGDKYGSKIEHDTTEENKLNITDKTIQEEIAESNPADLEVRSPVVTFMGHVDHGKTSLIGKIRTINMTVGEAGGITQHIGAFRCQTSHGMITILDTPGHEAFTAMRERGANATDVVVIVVAGDQGVEEQTKEAIKQARMANATIIVAINKSDKENYNPESAKMELSKLELIPEEWGGDTIMINCSATTGEGVNQLLESAALLAEMLQLKANPKASARGIVLEAQMDKGLGATATVLVQNGTLRPGDAIVFPACWGRVRMMQDEHGVRAKEAGPAVPMKINGLSAIPEAGDDFIVIADDKEARELAQKRSHRKNEQLIALRKRKDLEKAIQEDAAEKGIKVLNIIIRADMQGSVEALEQELEKIISTKAKVHILHSQAGEVKESDVISACTSKACILSFHNRIDKFVETKARQLQVPIFREKVIYHAMDTIKAKLKSILDKLPEEVDQGSALVKATFKSSKLGLIAGCEVTSGMIHRKHLIRIKRAGEQVWNGHLSSIRRGENDVAEVKNGIECGFVLQGNFKVEEGDIIEAYDIAYRDQEL